MKTVYKKIDDIRRRHAGKFAGVVAVGAAVAFILSQVIPALNDAFITSGAISALILALVVEISYTLSLMARSQQGWTVSRDQDSDIDLLRARASAVHIARADFLEYSAATVEPIIQLLRNRGSDMRILVKHPESEDVTSSQRDRILVQLRHYLNLVFNDPNDRATIRCYKQPASVRGRRLGNSLVNVGWYTPDVKNPDMGVRGHTNPLITADLATPEGEALRRMFQTLFDLLWEEAEDGRAVLQRHP